MQCHVCKTPNGFLRLNISDTILESIMMIVYHQAVPTSVQYMHAPIQTA